MNQNSDPFIQFAKASIGKEEEEAVLAVLRSGWLTTGEVTHQFEEDFARFVGAKHAIAVCSGTAALHLALYALDITSENLVITSPYTFTASAEVVRYVNAHPHFVDIEETSFNIDPVKILKEIHKQGKRVRCILPIHVGGHPCDMKTINEIATQHGLSVVEDAAHAFPSLTKNGYAGTLGSAGAYSFYVTKSITTGEGGMLVTQDTQIAENAKILRLHGIDRPVWNRYRSNAAGSWEYDVVAPGYKYNMTDLAAALGRTQLQKATVFLDRRRQIAGQYLRSLEDLDFLIMPPQSVDHSWHLFMLQIVPSKLTISRDQFMQELLNRGIGVSHHFRPLHLMSYYKKKYGLKPEDFPIALQKSKETFSIPIYPALSDEQVTRIYRAVTEIGLSHYKHHA